MTVCLSLWVWVPFLRSQAQGKLRLKNDLQASIFQQCVSLSTQYAGKAVFLRGRKGIIRVCVFRPLSSRDCLADKVWDLQACQEALPSRVRAECLPAFSEPCDHIPRLHHDCPWGSWLLECLWECWGNTVVTLWRWHSTAKACGEELRGTSFLPNAGPNLVLSEVRKQWLDGFSRSC